MKNTIAERVYDFLKGFPPFNLLQEQKLMEITTEVKIIYLEKGKQVFDKNDVLHDDFYIVRDGAIGLYKREENQQTLIDICDSGDIFGLRPLISKESYLLRSLANEESIVYGIPIATFKRLSEKSTKINKYLITSFASKSFDPYTMEESSSVFTDYVNLNTIDLNHLQTANYTKNPLTCHVASPLKDAAIEMSQHKIGCIVVVNDQSFPVGIITNSDIKNKIATGLFPIDVCVEKIMSSPVITQNKNITVLEAQLQMVKHNVGHLCITKDGTSNSKLVGILTHHDVLVSLGSNPSVLLKEIKKAKKTSELRSARNKANQVLQSYLEQNIPFTHIATIISEINDAVTIRAIDLAIQKMNTPPPVKFAWMALGSQGRREQLLYTDQDNALLFEDVPKKNYEATKAYFLSLAQLVNTTLYKIGYEYCPADMMAKNPNWCLSLNEWKAQFNDWIVNTDEKAMLLSSIFFDFNYVYGASHLVKELSNSLYETANKRSLFFFTLGKEAVKSPSPLGFFKQFLVENNGEHKDFFNIKSRALMPLIDAARLLILQHNVLEINNTASRFEKLAELEPNTKELFHSCAYAFKALSKFKTKQGLLHNDSGQFIELESLTKEEKLKLKRCFKPIREIQELLIIRFNLSNII